MASRVLIIDDEQSIRYSLTGVLEDEGYNVLSASSGEEGMALAEGESLDLVFLDIWLPGLDGLEVLARLRELEPGLPVVMISGHGNIETAVSAIKLGAFDFIEKPLSLEKVVLAASKALEFGRLKRENLELKARVGPDSPRRLSGESPCIESLREQITKVGPTEAWVLITGENGTGKEIVARQVHAHSPRASRPLIAVNCAAIPEELVESELFGYEKGAFTGAEASTPGKFELANASTLFLDEIGDMSLKTQAKVLRILQEQRFERIGGRRTLSVDVRVIAATNKDLEADIAAGLFRKDLYYRLKVFPLHVPPLRERPDDIKPLAEEFVAQLCQQHNFRPLTFTGNALQTLTAYPWPGNVRELKNFVERMLIMHGGHTVRSADLPPEFKSAAPCPTDGDILDVEVCRGPVDLKTARAEFERRFLETKLKECGGSVSRLAEAVGLERSSLYRKLKAYTIQVNE